FTRACNIVRAMQYGLHPFQTRVPCGADLLPGEFGRRQRQVRLAALMERELAVTKASAHDFALVGHIDVEIADIASGTTKSWVAGSRDPHPIEQPHLAIHFQTEIRDIVSGSIDKCLHP